MKFSIKPLIIDLRPTPKRGFYVYDPIQISTPWFSIDTIGIEFSTQKYGSIIWLWYWKRTGKAKWYSIDFASSYGTLKEIATDWHFLHDLAFTNERNIK